MIQQRLWHDDESYSNTVNVHITSLRRKIDAPFAVKLIHTIHGVGYTLRAPESEAPP
jgi:two-component system copper resistance phosphate regulon response regulator CusR